MQKIYIGIDPGKDGAMAIIDGENVRIVHASEGYLHKLLDIQGAFAVVERVSAMPGQGVVSMFHFGVEYGHVLGMLDALQIPYQTVPPRTWKKAFSLTGDKEKSIETAKRLFPGVNLKRTERCKKEHDGMAEALLMAEYARRILK